MLLRSLRPLCLLAPWLLALAGCKTSASADDKPAAATRPAEGNAMIAVLSSGGSLGPKPATYKAALPAALRKSLQAAGPAALLQLEGVQSSSPVSLRVFVNLPSANLGTPLSEPHFAGIVAAGETLGGSSRPVSSTLEIASPLRELVAASAEVAVTLVPAGKDDQEPAALALTHKAISLTLAQ